jgi:hypothetical protein
MTSALVALAGAVGIWVAIWIIVGSLCLWELIDPDLKVFLGRVFWFLVVCAFGAFAALVFYHNL